MASVKKRRRPGLTNLCVLIPEELHRRLKAMVSAQGTTLQAWLPPLLEAALEVATAEKEGGDGKRVEAEGRR